MHWLQGPEHLTQGGCVVTTHWLDHSLCASRISMGTIAKASSCVLSKFTGQATPALAASNQVWAHTHQQSPGLSPGNPYCGTGVIKSLPCDLANNRKSSVKVQHTTCEPRSLASVLQHPSRYHPVIGSVEHGWSSVPLTLTLGCMLLRPISLS